MLVGYDDENIADAQSKAERLRDESGIDINTQLMLWKQTLQYRRQYIRNRSTSDILKEFPGYSNPILVSLFFAISSF